jgi:hypothetical protein
MRSEFNIFSVFEASKTMIFMGVLWPGGPAVEESGRNGTARPAETLTFLSQSWFLGFISIYKWRCVDNT